MSERKTGPNREAERCSEGWRGHADHARTGKQKKASEGGGQINQGQGETICGSWELGCDPGESRVYTVPGEEARQVLGPWA